LFVFLIVIGLVKSTRHVRHLAAQLAGEALAFFGRLEGLGKGITRLAYGILDILSASCIFMFRSLSLSFLFPLAFLPELYVQKSTAKICPAGNLLEPLAKLKDSKLGFAVVRTIGSLNPTGLIIGSIVVPPRLHLHVVMDSNAEIKLLALPTFFAQLFHLLCSC
jgi:hypothetical protein